MSQNTFTVNSGTTSVFLDLPVLESAAGITLVGADSTGEPASEEFQVGFPIIEDTDFTFETEPFAPVSGSLEHSGTVTLGVGGSEVTVGDFSIGFDEARVSETASGFFVADTTEDALGLEILFDVGVPGSVAADSESLEIAEADLLVAPEFAEALGATELTGADIGDTRVDASTASATEEEAVNLLEAEDLTVNLSAEVNAANKNVGGLYQAIDTEGTVVDPVSGAEIGLDDEGYVDAAIANSIAEIADGEAITLDLEGDFVYVPYLLANGEQFFSSFAEVNPENFDNIQSLGENTFGFEDAIGGGDLDFDDLILTVETV